MLQQVMNAFDIVFKRRKLNVNGNKSNVIFDRAKEVVVDFMKPYRVRAKDENKIMLEGIEIKKIWWLKYLRIVVM